MLHGLLCAISDQSYTHDGWNDDEESEGEESCN